MSSIASRSRPIGFPVVKPRNLQRQWLLDLFEHALKRVDPLLVVPQHLPPRPKGRTVVIGAGKASARMARALEQEWDGPLSGLVVTRYGHTEPCERITVLEAGHPVPDEASHGAAQSMLGIVGGLTKDDLVISLMSGGGSSLLALPCAGVTLADKQMMSRELLRCGAAIGEINVVRGALSAVKGGQLAQACGSAALVTLVISDVPDDDPSVVSSGPTVARRSTSDTALAVLGRYGITVPEHLRTVLESPALQDTQAATGERIVRVIATAADALSAAQRRAEALGLGVLSLGSRIEGEASEVGRVHAGVALGLIDARRGGSGNRSHGGSPIVLLSGGETTVTVRAKGRGGRNTEFLLGFALGCADREGIHALACDTDGIDGSQCNAGAFADGQTVARARAADMDAVVALARNDSYSIFRALGDLVVTGPTRTNVNDFRAVVIE